MNKLGVIQDTVVASTADIDRYKATFAAPLSPSKQEALQVLFSGVFDPEAMGLDLVGLEEEAM